MTVITVETIISSSLDNVWDAWTTPEHITKWNFAADSWCCPHATNDLRAGGTFSWRMEAKDGSFGFDFAGTYENVNLKEKICSSLGDGRKIIVTFTQKGENEVLVTEEFEAEAQNSEELQRNGWQSILNNFKKYVESW